jgi:hypothetical protein
VKNAPKNLAAKIGIDIDLHTIKDAAWSNGKETDYVNAFKVEPRLIMTSTIQRGEAVVFDNKWILNAIRSLHV